jgi:hypothetical protein
MCRVHEISDRFRANLFRENPSIHCEMKCNCKPTALGTCPRYYAHICGRSSSILTLDMPRMIINLKLLNSVVHGPHPGRKSKVRTPSNPRYTRPIKSPNGQGHPEHVYPRSTLVPVPILVTPQSGTRVKRNTGPSLPPHYYFHQLQTHRAPDYPRRAGFTLGEYCLPKKER